jgi:hypothetical protein
MIALSIDTRVNLTPGNSSLALGAQLLVRGELDILKIITASVMLLLRAELAIEGTSKKLKCTGQFQLKIKVFFFTIDIDQSVEWTRELEGASSSGGSPKSSGTPYLPPSDATLIQSVSDEARGTALSDVSIYHAPRPTALKEAVKRPSNEIVRGYLNNLTLVHQ